MENFDFHVSTDIRFGKARLAELPAVLNDFGKNVLLVYGGGSIKKNGLYDRLQALFAKNGNHVSEVAGVAPNPRIETVETGVNICKKKAIDVILAVGGGSVIDCSKAIAGGVYVAGDLWSDFVEKRSYDGPALPIVTILTLAATGSEMNNGGVISNLTTQQKLGVHGDSLLPKVSFLDPSLTFSVPAYQTAAGSADILSHLLETYFNRTPGTEIQDGISEGIMKTVIKYLPIALKTPDDYEARANLMWSSTWALNGLTGSGKVGCWSCHAMEHELSAFYDVTHGIGLAILTPRWMLHVLNEKNVAKFARFARNVWGVTETDPETAARSGIQKLYEFFLTCDIPMTLPEIGIDSEKFAEMAQRAVSQNKIATDAYVPLQKEDVMAIYQASMTSIKF